MLWRWRLVSKLCSAGGTSKNGTAKRGRIIETIACLEFAGLNPRADHQRVVVHFPDVVDLAGVGDEFALVIAGRAG